MRPTADNGAGASDEADGTGIRRRLLSAVAAQLGRPHGVLGRVVAVALNRGNRPAIVAAVQLSAAAPGEVVADIGFGGGAGLSLLLGRVGDGGVVYGVEISEEMLERARLRNGQRLAAGQLRLAAGSLTALPLEDRCLDAAITVNTVYFVAELDDACRDRPASCVLAGESSSGSAIQKQWRGCRSPATDSPSARSAK